jgi:hypothetical protein
MADMTLCTNKTCPQRSNCKRATTKSEPLYQSYMEFKWDEKEGCEFQYPITPFNEEEEKEI